MNNLADELRRHFSARLGLLQRFIEDLHARFPPVLERARLALDLYSLYCRAADAAVASDWNHAFDAADRVDLLRFHLRDLSDRAAELEDWFAGALSEVVPPGLVDAVERELGELLHPLSRQVILSIGSADNYETLVTELQDLVLGALGPHRPSLPPELAVARFALLRLPRLESSEPSWRPVILGHEVAHLALLERPTIATFDIDSRLDPAYTATLSVPQHLSKLRPNPALAIKTAAEEWVEELICDAYAVRRFGPAALASLGGFFEFVGAFDEAGDHPPGWLRCRLLAYWLGDNLVPPLSEVVLPWQEIAAIPRPAMPDWANFLCDQFWQYRDEIPQLLVDWPAKYEIAHRKDLVEWIAAEFRAGIARADGVGAPEAIAGEQFGDPDVINAGWVARLAPGPVPIDRLVDKSLESVDFIRRWSLAGGDLVDVTQPAAELPEGVTTLGANGVVTRLFHPNPAQRLVISPACLSSPRGASIDVRLGKHFIVFERSSTPAVSAIGRGARRLQAAVEKSWDDFFVLHPGELVLASTLEYIVIPSDIAATVITRSSYGRLGLITATAIFIHPWFKGCLTLELVNLGQVPLELQPGERIAQLVLQKIDPPQPQPATDKYMWNTRPEFSRVSGDDEIDILRSISRHHN